jgi:hypothetical protein
MDLLKFCGTDRYQSPFTKPDGYVYATDGRIIVRRPQKPEDDFEMSPLAISDLQFSPSGMSAVQIPNITGKPCEECWDGFIYTCPECDGAGFLKFSNAFNVYECECRTCSGGGISSVPRSENEDPYTKTRCPQCRGTKVQDLDGVSVFNGGYALANFYLFLIQDLHGIQLFQPNDTQDSFFLAPAYFKFSGGEGLICPMRPK